MSDVTAPYDPTETPQQNVDRVLALGERANVSVAQWDALIADRARYRHVARQVIQWDLQAPRPRAAGVEDLVNTAQAAIAAESKP